MLALIIGRAQGVPPRAPCVPPRLAATSRGNFYKKRLPKITFGSQAICCEQTLGFAPPSHGGFTLSLCLSPQFMLCDVYPNPTNQPSSLLHRLHDIEFLTSDINLDSYGKFLQIFLPINRKSNNDIITPDCLAQNVHLYVKLI
jgi:hypothetical protein